MNFNKDKLKMFYPMINGIRDFGLLYLGLGFIFDINKLKIDEFNIFLGLFLIFCSIWSVYINAAVLNDLVFDLESDEWKKS